MTRSARLAALGAAILFSTGGAAIKVAAFSTPQVSGLRSGIAALTLLLWYRRYLTWTRWTGPAAIAYAATLTLFVAATRQTTAANAIFLQYTAPIYVLLLSPLALDEHISRRDLPFLVALTGGTIVCFLGQTRATVTAPNPGAGNLLAAGAGVAWAATLISLRHFNRRGDRSGQAEGGITVVIAGNALASVGALPLMFPLPNAPAAAWLTLVYLGVI